MNSVVDTDTGVRILESTSVFVEKIRTHFYSRMAQHNLKDRQMHGCLDADGDASATLAFRPPVPEWNSRLPLFIIQRRIDVGSNCCLQ